MDAPVSVATDGGVVGLNFHQSKEVLITDSINGSSYTVSSDSLRLFAITWWMYI